MYICGRNVDIANTKELLSKRSSYKSLTDYDVRKSIKN